MINIYLCDDIAEILDDYSRKIKTIACEYGCEVKIKTFRSGKELMEMFRKNPGEADIVYLDVMLGEASNGIDYGRQMRDEGYGNIIIFLSANDEYVFDSFNVLPLNFLVKGKSNHSEFKRVLEEAFRQADIGKNECVVYTQGTVVKRIPIREIRYIAAQGRTTIVHYERGTFELYTAIKTQEEKLKDHRFVRISRTFLVNSVHVKEIQEDEVVLLNEEHLPIGGKYKLHAKMKLADYFLDSFKKYMA